MSVPLIVTEEAAAARLNDEHVAAMEGLRRARAVGVRAFIARFLAQPFAVAGLVLLGFVTAASVFAPLIAPYDPFALNPPLQQPSSTHWLGTDPLGRDRSEEHTSELQSQSNLVCRLLLEKKKKNKHK